MSERHSLIDTITDSLAPVHRDGHKFIAIGAGVALLLLPALAAARLAVRCSSPRGSPTSSAIPPA